MDIPWETPAAAGAALSGLLLLLTTYNRVYRWTLRQREQDEELLLLCTSAFLNKKYNDRILQYLSDFYSGPVETMLRLWRAAQDFELRTRDLEVSEQLFFEFRQMERRNRNLLQWDERHREFSEVWDETLNRRALKLPKSIEEQMIEAERAELLCKAVDRLPEIQRRRFLLYYEYEFNFYQIAAMEHCTASAIQKSVAVAKKKVKAEMRKYLQP